MQRVRAILTKLHGERCPCCGQGMQKSKANRQVANTKTKGHIYHSNDRRWKEDDWFYMCYRCNQDQGALSLWEWAAVLRMRDDLRWRRVLYIICEIKIDFVESHIKHDREESGTTNGTLQGDAPST